MAYFSHAFQKVMWGGNEGDTGFVTAGNYTDFIPGGAADTGSFGFVDHTVTNAANPWPVAAAAPANGEPLTLVSTSILQNDKIGPFHGGYQEANKSKVINPRYVHKFYKVQAALPQTNIIGVGATPNLDLAGADAACCPSFYCNENYHLRVDLKGSPLLRMLNHNAYQVAASYTGCCDGPTPELVDPAEVMFDWAKYINDDPIFSGANHGPAFTGLTDQRLVNVGVTVTCDDGTTWDLYLPDNANAGVAGLYFEADGTTPTALATAFAADLVAATGILAFASVAPISSYVSAFTPEAPNCCAGLVMQAAFAETKFDSCTFQPTDHFEVEPMLMQASMLDETGDPCVFEQLCISDGITPSGSGSGTVYPAIQFGTQAMGTGESVLRELLLSESYNQNYLATDLRIREITQGNDLVDEVNRTSLYTCYYILHTVPRYNNATGVFDNDQYLLKIPVEDSAATGTGIPAFETFVNTWLANAGNPVQLEVY